MYSQEEPGVNTLGNAEQRVALVTGGSGGIGEACGAALVRHGYDVVLTARREAPLVAAAGRIGARWAVADAAEPSQMDDVVTALGRVDVLVHAAGILDGTFVRKESVDTFDAVLRANLRSAFVATHAVLPSMGVGGRIIFISSTAAHDGHPGRSAYSASKAGMNGFALSLAREVSRDGITVHTISPGPVDTAMLDDVTFEVHTIDVQELAAAIEYIDGLARGTELDEIVLRPALAGPHARAPLVPPAAQEKLANAARLSAPDS
jgi:NAD(P)-dependent dehydrogenase (short-subunit alcohol dehydrogenase family)